jgi:TRAP-type C4-dicarboxylate transport system substrate-binding protein
MKYFKFAVVVTTLLYCTVSAYSKVTVIKFATLAPKGSTWMKIMDQFTHDVEKQTEGEIKFKIYAGGVHGDEKDVVRKIRFNQLHSAGFTGVGLGIIAPHLRILDSPFLFNTTEEIDFIYDKFDKEFRNYLMSRNFVLLGWAEVGFVHLFTNKPVTKLADLKGVKMWMWEGDPIAEAAFRHLAISAVSLSITDVMTSLQTGLIDGIYGSTLSVTALQWFTKIKYMFNLRISNANGAVVISKKKFYSLKPEHRKILLKLGSKYFRNLTLQSRLDNHKALAALKKEGVIITKPESIKAENDFKFIGETARMELAGKLYPKHLLIRIEKALEEFRTRRQLSF